MWKYRGMLLEWVVIEQFVYRGRSEENVMGFKECDEDFNRERMKIFYVEFAIYPKRDECFMHNSLHP